MPTLASSTEKSQHGAWIEIRPDRLKQNLQTLRREAGPKTGILAVVKANAYGHGLIETAKTLDGQVEYLGVSSIREALDLKEHGLQTPVFLFGRLLSSEIPVVLRDGITLSVSSLEEASEISEISLSLNRRTPVHVKVDTGMGRLGMPYRSAVKNIERIKELAGIELEGLYTHFPTSETPDGFATQQVYDFSLLLQALEAKGIRFTYRHAANSGGILNIKTPVFNLARPGLSLYGIYPDRSLHDLITLRPILSLKSRMIFLKHLQPGQSVGYGRDFVAKQPSVIATLPVGYSHGYPFRLSNRAYVLYQGKPCPVAGRVSMDYLCIDVTPTHPKIGDEVTLLGQDGQERITAENLADWAGTIPYEIVTQLAAHLPRFYR